MADDPSVEIPGAPALAVPLAATAPCCAASDPQSAGQCALCQRPICKNCLGLVNLKQVCADCRTQVLAELEAEKAAPAKLPVAVLFGAGAALVCGIAWALMVVWTKYEIGFAAVGVGFVTGWAVLTGARGKRGRNLQWLAVACAVLWLLCGKYFIVAHTVVTEVKEAQGASMFDPRMISVFFRVFPHILSPWDFLWAFIAFRAAWQIPKPRTVHVR